MLPSSRLGFLLQVLLGDGATSVGDIGFRRSPLTLGFRPLLGGEPSGGGCSSILSSGFSIPRGEVAFSSWTIRLRGSTSALPSSLFVLVHQWEAGFLQGLPFGLRYGFGKLSLRSDECFSRLRGGSHRSTRDFDEVRWSRLADIPFSGLSAAPFLSRLRAARVLLRRWLPSSQTRSPSRSLPPQGVSAKGLFDRTPILRST